MNDTGLNDVAKSRLERLPSAVGWMARLAYSQAKAAGVAVEPLLDQSGLRLCQMEQPHLRLAVRHQIKFLNLAAEALGDEFLGFHLARQPDLREAGLLYYVMASSDLLIDALQRGARYTSIVNEGILTKVSNPPDVRIVLSYAGVSRHLDRHQVEFWITALVRICRQLTGLRLSPSLVRLVHFRDRRISELSEYFGSEIEFGAPVDEIIFDKRVRDLPVNSADPYLNNLLCKYCEDAMAKSRIHRGSFRSRVENAIVPLLPHRRAQVGEAARRLGVSRRTLARGLAREGLTFSWLLERLRIDLARRYLQEESLPISEIAWLLGYQEVGAFSHAFKRWTGQSPRAARAHAALPVDEPLSPNRIPVENIPQTDVLAT